MAGHYLATYLNDHLAGSQVALEILRHLEKEHANTPIAAFATSLRAEIEADREELQALMERLGIGQSGPRKATAWLTEKLTEVKLRLDDPGGGEFRLLEMLEALSLGIEGKHSLWQALEEASGGNPTLRAADYPSLRRRAVEQRGDVEKRRLEAAKGALGEHD